MKKFIISDIHGNGNLYYAMMYYLDNISKGELAKERNYLNSDFYPQKLIKLDDGIIGYRDWKK